MTLPSIATLSGGTALLTDNEERLKVERLYSFFGGGLLNLRTQHRKGAGSAVGCDSGWSFFSSGGGAQQGMTGQT